MRIRHVFSVDLPDGSFVLSFVALPAARAVALLGSRDGRRSWMRIDAGEKTIAPLDEVVAGTAGELPARSGALALASVGEGFALVTHDAVTAWRQFDADPRHYRREDPFPANAHGFRAGVFRGGVSEDPNAALLLLHEPQYGDAATRYASLRLDDGAATARWDGLLADGQPPGLDRDEFPVPEYWRASGHLDEVRPFLDHGAYVGGKLFLFALGGLNANFARWGMDYSLAVRVDAGHATIAWQAPESCWGQWSSSGRYLIVRPLRPKGPMKGATQLIDTRDLTVHRLEPPRGHGKLRPVDHRDGFFWMTNEPSPTPRVDAFVVDD